MISKGNKQNSDHTSDDVKLYLDKYEEAIENLGNMAEERKKLIKKIFLQYRNKKCLQIGIKDEIGKKFGKNWIAVDLYDKREGIDYNYDIQDLKFESECFDLVACISVLEHVENPVKAIREIHRVLKPGGIAWVQLPFNFPYHEFPKDFWRVSPDGLRIWMKAFEEILCGSYLYKDTSLVVSTFYFGKK